MKNLNLKNKILKTKSTGRLGTISFGKVATPSAHNMRMDLHQSKHMHSFSDTSLNQPTTQGFEWQHLTKPVEN